MKKIFRAVASVSVGALAVIALGSASSTGCAGGTSADNASAGGTGGAVADASPDSSNGSGGIGGTGGGTGGVGGGAAGTGGIVGTGGGAGTGGGGGGAGVPVDAGDAGDAADGDAADSGDPCAQPEVCDGLDNNCNGAIDEGDPGGGETCTVPSVQGVCSDGLTMCSSGFLTCEQITQPSPEICDGLDNNCNGSVDEGDPEAGDACPTGLLGICAAGTTACNAGTLECEQNITSQPEACNGLDDDCDGVPDNGFGGGDPCTVTGVPPGTPCADGLTTCLTGQNSCAQVVFARSEICDGIDNDCDQTIDNAAVVNDRPCDTGFSGVCMGGLTNCGAGVETCIPQVQPGAQIETCNTLDDDCDGTIDNVPNINLECGANNPLAQNVVSWACTTGFCQVASCSGQFADCNGAPGDGCEVDLRIDPVNCGVCATVCDSTNGTAVCANSMCGIVCNPGNGNCDMDASNGCETNTNTTLAHCGACGVACTNPNGPTSCSGGTCQPVCDPDRDNCDMDPVNGCETNTLINVNHCGACNLGCINPNGTTNCLGGTCNPSCTMGFDSCDGNVANGCETNLNTDELHCGDCATECLNVNSLNTCTSGSCVPACSGMFASCDGNGANGCETDTGSDEMNCGGCGIQCQAVNGSNTCVLGICIPSCANGFGDCDPFPENGCETDIRSDDLHCGACGTECLDVNGTNSCVNRICVPSCNAGFDDCSDPTDGCETDIFTDPDTCGSCSTSCTNPNGTRACAGGICTPGCNPGFKDCTNPIDGCETDIFTDLSNCGDCGDVCNNPNGSESCVGGNCQIGCDPGFGDCNAGIPGCETDIFNDELNCGGCNIVCQQVNGTNTCVNGQCVPACNTNFGNCDAIGPNGCETNLLTSDLHCGTCMNECQDVGGTNTCSSGTCSPSCSPGNANCDGNLPNGCETNTTNDEAHCNGCNMACSTAGTVSNLCIGSACTPVCLGGFGDCDSNTYTGCETDITSDEQNCGVCGTVCQTAGTTSNNCQSGACNPICNIAGGFGNCDGNNPNGCETNTNTDVDHCGMCNIDCNSPLPPNASSATCSSGNCAVQNCNSNRYDQDMGFANGCECTGDTYSNVCSSPFFVNGGSPIVVDGTVDVLGNALPTPTDRDWFRVEFQVQNVCSFNPSIQILGGAPVAMRVHFGTCGGAGANCAEPGSSSSADRTTWDFNYVGGPSACGDLLSIDPTPVAGPFIDPTEFSNPLIVFIEVKPTGSSTTCLDYTLRVSN